MRVRGRSDIGNNGGFLPCFISLVALYIPGEESFEMKIGGTTYEVNTHFSTEGRQSVLEQFMELIMNDHLI